MNLQFAVLHANLNIIIVLINHDHMVSAVTLLSYDKGKPQYVCSDIHIRCTCVDPDTGRGCKHEKQMFAKAALPQRHKQPFLLSC